MICSSCGEEMKKLKYLHYEELEAYLKSEYEPSAIEDYTEWLLSLLENDLIVTLFQREDDSGIKEKYYLRFIEKKTPKGIKLKGLSKIFPYETGAIVYGKKEAICYVVSTYKIMPINEQVDAVIREYCINKDKFDIDKLNKIISIPPSDGGNETNLTGRLFRSRR